MAKKKSRNNKTIWSIFASVLTALFFVITQTNSGIQFYEYLKTYNKKDINLSIRLEKEDINKTIHAHSASGRGNPYISSIGSWYQFRITNDGRNPVSITNILYQGRSNITPYTEYSKVGETIHIGAEYPIPKMLSPQESIKIYLFIPIKTDKEFGKKLFHTLHVQDKKIDTTIEAFLFGKEPSVTSGTLPMYVDGIFVRTIPIENIHITNINDMIVNRDLFEKDSKGIILFDHKINDGFSYMNVNGILSKVIDPTSNEINLRSLFNCNDGDVKLTFDTNTGTKFTTKLYVDSTCMNLVQ